MDKVLWRICGLCGNNMTDEEWFENGKECTNPKCWRLKYLSRFRDEGIK